MVSFQSTVLKYLMFEGSRWCCELSRDLFRSASTVRVVVVVSIAVSSSRILLFQFYIFDPKFISRRQLGYINTFVKFRAGSWSISS